MDFTESLIYPHNSNNLFGKAFLLTIMMMIPLVNLLAMFVLMGYGIKIIYAVSHGDLDLPDIDIADDAVRGFTVFIASLVYFIPFSILSVMLQIFLQDSALLLSISLIITMVHIILSTVFLIGIVRFGVTGDSDMMFRVRENFEIASNNIGTLITFYFMQMGMLLFLVFGMIIGFMFFVLPGLIVMIAGVFSFFHLYAQLGAELGLVGKMKRKVQEY